MKHKTTPKATVKASDELYQFKREQLIPLAEKHADKVAGQKPKTDAALTRWNAKWSALFHAEMERLWREEQRKGGEK